MIKKISGIAVALAFAALPFVASAATLSYPLFSNGQTNIDATGGSTVNGTATLTVGPGEVVEWLRSQSDFSQPFTDASVGGTLGYQEGVYLNVPFSVKVPPNTGTYNPTLQGAGTFGGGRSINGGDNVVFGPSSLGTIRVVAGSTSIVEPVIGSGSVFGFNSFAEFIAALKLAMTPPTPAKPAGCTGVVAFNGSNAYAAQGSLFAVDAGRAVFNASHVYAPTGYFGPISASAAAAVSVACN